MLTYIGSFDEQELIDALKAYLPLYGREKEIVNIPFKNGSMGEKHFGEFQMLGGTWVCVEVK